MKKVDTLKVGRNTPDPAESGWVQFGDSYEMSNDGNVYLIFGTAAGTYARFSMDRPSFTRFVAAAATNMRLLGDIFKPVGLILTPLDGGEPIKVSAESLTLRGDKLIVTHPDGTTRELHAAMHAIEYEFSKPEPPPIIGDDDLDK